MRRLICRCELALNQELPQLARDVVAFAGADAFLVVHHLTCERRVSGGGSQAAACPAATMDEVAEVVEIVDELVERDPPETNGTVSSAESDAGRPHAPVVPAGARESPTARLRPGMQLPVSASMYC